MEYAHHGTTGGCSPQTKNSLDIDPIVRTQNSVLPLPLMQAVSQQINQKKALQKSLSMAASRRGAGGGESMPRGAAHRRGSAETGRMMGGLPGGGDGGVAGGSSFGATTALVSGAGGDSMRMAAYRRGSTEGGRIMGMSGGGAGGGSFAGTSPFEDASTAEMEAGRGMVPASGGASLRLRSSGDLDGGGGIGGSASMRLRRQPSCRDIDGGGGGSVASGGGGGSSSMRGRKQLIHQSSGLEGNGEGEEGKRRNSLSVQV